MTPVALYSPEPARGWLPWGALAPLLAMVFVVSAIMIVALRSWRMGLISLAPNLTPAFMAFEHKSPLASLPLDHKRFDVHQLQLNLPLREIFRQRQEDGGFIDPHSGSE